jgi:hypothetical protein
VQPCALRLATGDKQHISSTIQLPCSGMTAALSPLTVPAVSVLAFTTVLFANPRLMSLHTCLPLCYCQPVVLILLLLLLLAAMLHSLC